jgi:RNA polymerase primary sigma factor
MKQLTITTKLTNRENQSFVQYLREVSEIKVLTPEEEVILTNKASSGDKQAIEELVKRNLRFVVSVAKQYATPQNPVEDLVNEGNIGLMMAAERFDPKTGFKFISYAVWWIRKIIMEHLSKNGRLIRLPSNKINALSKLDKQINELEQKLGRNVSIREVMDNYNVDVDVLDALSNYGKSSSDLEVLNMLSGYSMDSLDRELGHDENGSTLGDNVADDTFGTNDHNLMYDDMKSELNKVLDTLKPRDRQVIVALFGLDGSIPRTLKDVGDEIGVTREMVRQIKEKSLAKLKKRLHGSEILE